MGFVVAFSCKGRGVCPSCNGRHMTQTAAHLVDHVIPPVPVRQWVIREILTHLGEPLEPPPVSPARGPPTDWGEFVQIHDDRETVQGRIDELPVIDIHSL